MRLPFRIAGIAAAAYLIVYAALYLQLRLSPASDPHAALRDPARCRMCHMEETPPSGRPYRQLNFRKDIYTLCTQCHPRPVTHPVEIAPRHGTGGDLPLDADGAMTCVTCHSPHGPAQSTKEFAGRTLEVKLRDTFFPFLPGRHRTWFLRISNTRGELCERCHANAAFASRAQIARTDRSEYVGSRSCRPCHREESDEWRRSPHARMVRTPVGNPGSVLAKFEGTSPFPPSEIAYVLGSRTAQRFVSRKGEDLVVRTPIWIVRSRSWNLDYWREQDWRKSCAGCHVTGYDPAAGDFSEGGIGCEACHGPGRAHASTGRSDAIVHPGKLTAERRAMVCEQCHTTGHDATGEYRFPVGYSPGADLSRYFFGLVPKPGQDDTTFRGDGSSADRHAQYRFWASRMLVAEGETCDLCRNFRSAGAGGSVEPRKLTPEEFCVSCHGGNMLPPPRHHAEPDVLRSDGCLPCHPVRRTRAGTPSVHDHKFLPREALAEDPPAPSVSRNPCSACHISSAKGGPP